MKVSWALEEPQQMRGAMTAAQGCVGSARWLCPCWISALMGCIQTAGEKSQSPLKMTLQEASRAIMAQLAAGSRPDTSWPAKNLLLLLK